MEIILTEEQVKAHLGELKFIGAVGKYGYVEGKRTEEFETVVCTLGAPRLGGSIEIKLETSQLPNVKEYATVKVENLAYSPYATVTTFGDRSNGKMVDRFVGTAIIPISSSDRLADENGEKVESKPKLK
ncbi:MULTISPECIES: hypothetical protein [unclassified Listeria]|uniref:hypothetical protein n=1 Tax=unclassified Listeria TaxID=2642072 RepID=UPI000B58A753|nr:MULTISPECIES: hypothetical protein [unclassified Listeria]